MSQEYMNKNELLKLTQQFRRQHDRDFGFMELKIAVLPARMLGSKFL